jgi:DNA polymerase-3 subunit gamma/tau
MAYVSLYRKYRPQDFDDVVGQEHVTTTLRNAIAAGRVANGYLFCGTRGTAKTTCARILAKALNCIGPDGTLTSPVTTPCNVCAQCLAITSSSLVDVVEIDAASHGKVEDVRDLTANIKFPPMVGRYKVYIIDEAHQLSRDAMDAFLKTLEEPPDRVVFVLATTEPDKLPVTIASRCQVFEFRRGTLQEIESRLRHVLELESATAQDAALRLLSRAADGSYRDSLTLLEQVLAYKRQDISRKDVNLVLGMVDDEMVDRAVALIGDANLAELMNFAEDVIAGGKDVRHFLQGLSRRLRDLLVVQLGASESSLESDIDTAVLREQAARFSPDTLIKHLRVLAASEREVRTSTQHRLLLELALLNLAGHTGDHAGGAGVSATVRPPQPVRPASAPPERKIEPVVPVAQPAATPPATEYRKVLESARENPRAYSVHENNDTDSVAPLPLEPGHASMFDGPDAPTRKVALPDPIETVDRLNALWPQVINRMGAKYPAGLPFVREGRALQIVGQTITLELSTQLNVDKIMKNDRGRKGIEDIINKTLELPPDTYMVRCVLRSTNTVPDLPVMQKVSPTRSDDESPLMDKVIAEFGGTLLD